MSTIIAADIGGTNSRLALVERSGDELAHRFQRSFKSGAFADIYALLEHFLADSGAQPQEIDNLCLALAGPVESDSVQLTNLDWMVEKSELRNRCGFADLCFINDFQAAALGAATACESEIVILNEAPAEKLGRRVVLGAGTGLGVAYVHYEGDAQVAYATEGGHIDFAPRDDEEEELRRYLARRYGGHVSFERILSGQGLVDLYGFVTGSDVDPVRIDAKWVNEQATEFRDPAAMRALNIFIGVYGAFAGNMALLFKPEGGIDIAGGIGAKMRSAMQSDRFRDAYLDKGRMQRIAAGTAVRLVTDEESGLRGAIEKAFEPTQRG